MKTLISTALAASILVGGAAAYAQPGGGHGPGGRGGRMIEMLDGNKDGTITRDEASAALATRFDMMDTDKNGTITQAEREAMRTRMMKDRFTRMDTDKNGQLSQEEMLAARKAKRDGMRGKMGGKMGHMMRGDITRDQFMARPMAMFDRVDTNKDGQITAAERDAARDAMKKRWEARKDKRNAG